MLQLNKATVTLGDQIYTYSMSAKPGSTVAILGESGSGKSTLLNLIGGFLPLESGEILWNASSISSLPPDKRPVTSLFQQDNLFSHLTVAKNVALGLNPGLKLGSQDWQLVNNVLADVGLEGFEHRIPSSLSGGEQQRVALARCLIRRKPVLLLDEPYSALDQENREKMLDLTATICTNRDLCTLLVTHNLEDTERLNATVLTLSHGQLGS